IIAEGNLPTIRTNHFGQHSREVPLITPETVARLPFANQVTFRIVLIADDTLGPLRFQKLPCRTIFTVGAVVSAEEVSYRVGHAPHNASIARNGSGQAT